MFCFQYFEECHGVIYVVDCSDEKRLEESHNAFGKLTDYGLVAEAKSCISC